MWLIVNGIIRMFVFKFKDYIVFYYIIVVFVCNSLLFVLFKNWS